MKKLMLSLALALPALAETRAQAIAHVRAEVERECRRDAGGNWDRWLQQLAPFRASLLEKIHEAEARQTKKNPDGTTAFAVIEAVGPLPLFEVDPRQQAGYIARPESLGPFEKEQPVVKVARWLRAQGIDLIFVPVPKMTEVYAPRVASGVPADGIVAPNMRKLIRDLSRENVEVIDLLPTFLSAPHRDEDPLYNAADPHWSQRGRRIAAQVIAKRLARYAFVQTAQTQPPLFDFVPAEKRIEGAAWQVMDDEQRSRAIGVVEHGVSVVPLRGIQPVVPDSPIVFIGDSFNYGLHELVAKELNLPVTSKANGAQTTGAIADFVRDPSILTGRKVVIWVNCNNAIGAMPWPLPPLRDERQ